MKRKILIGLVLFAFVGLQSWFAYLMFHYPYLGINIESNSHGQWVIYSLDSESGSQQLNLRTGDIIKKLDGKDPNKHFSTKKWEIIEQVDAIQVERNGNIIDISTKDISRTSKIDILSLFSEGLSFFIVALLYFKADIHHSKSARNLSFVFFIYGITFMCLVASIRTDVIGSYVIGLCLMSAPVVFLHFLIDFFKEKCDIRLPRQYIKYLYGVLLFFAVLKLYDFNPLEGQLLHYISRQVSLVFFSIGIFIDFYVLFYIYIKYRKEHSYASTIIKTVLFSLFVSFIPVIIFAFIPQILGVKEWVSPAFTSWIVLFFPLSFAYLLITKQLYDIDVVLRRIAYTVLLSVIPSIAIIGVNAVVFQKDASVEHLALGFIIVLTIVSSILYSFEYFTTKLEAVMFPRKHFLQKALKKISKNLGAISSIHELKDIILVDIVNILQVYGGAIAFKYRDTTEIIHEGSIDPEEVRQLVETDESDSANYSRLEINSQEEYTSYLVLTRKKSNTLLGMEEIQWLNLIITYLAVSLENIFLIRKLTVKLQQFAAQIPDEHEANDVFWFRKLMFELQENERVRIATDLHDTTMQDLFFLKRRLTSLLEQYAFKKEDVEQMNSMIRYIEVINMNLRQNCFELHPHLLSEIGLVETIRKLIQQEMPICSFELTFEAGGFFTVEKRDMETKTHVFRIVQELLNNAKKHSQASKVKFSMSEAGNVLYLDYEDNGIGFDPKRPLKRDVGSPGMGIEQIKSRILYLKGHWELDTGGGLGVRFRITLPINREMTA